MTSSDWLTIFRITRKTTQMRRFTTTTSWRKWCFMRSNNTRVCLGLQYHCWDILMDSTPIFRPTSRYKLCSAGMIVINKSIIKNNYCHYGRYKIWLFWTFVHDLALSLFGNRDRGYYSNIFPLIISFTQIVVDYYANISITNEWEVTVNATVLQDVIELTCPL